MNADNNENTYDAWTDDTSMSTEKAKNSKKTLKRMAKALRPQKWQLIIAALFATAAVSLNLWAPMVFSRGIDTLVEGIMPAIMGIGEANLDFGRFGQIALLLVGIYVTSSILTYFQEFFMATVSQRLVLSLRERLSEKLAKVPLKFYDERKKGEILSRVTNDLERVNEILTSGIMRLYTSIIGILGAIILMATINWIVALVAVGSIILGIIVTAIVGTKSHKRFSDRQTSLGAFNTTIEESFSGQTEIKTFTLEEQVNEKTDAAIEDLYEKDRKAQFVMYAIMPIIRLANQIGYVAIAVLCARFVIQGSMSVGQIQAFFQYLSMSSEPLTEASFIANSFNAAIAAAERVFELLDEVEELQLAKGVEPKKIKQPEGNISFENVQFGYGEELLMNDISFDVKAGQKVAIVGPTGAGKTTLVNLLMRFYEVNGGSIKVDGIDIREFERKYLRSLFGMVLQDSWIFDGTVSENIAYGRSKAAQSEIIDAAKMARADYFIRTLPNGYESVMNDENANISQGQKQLLCIARAILSNPYILLLDEATSSVDTRTEVEIQKAMDNLMKGRTSFIIAHRLSTIKNADIILVMDKGTIVEKGTHEELLAKNGFYSEIYNSQFVSA